MSNPGEQDQAEPQPLDPKVETAVFGREVADFIERDVIGQYLIDQARLDLEQTQIAMLDVDPTDSKAIAALQLDARVAKRVRGWLAAAIQNGLDAETIIQQERDNVA
jgi:hypothetical protein